MAYKTTVSKYCANRQAALDEMFLQMEAMGWTLVDGNFTTKTCSYTAVDTTNNLFTISSHGLVNGTPCQVTSTGSVPGGLAINTIYYVVNQATDTFKLSTTYNGAAIDITTQGTGTISIKEAYRIYKSNGENSNRAYEYIKLQYYGDTTSIYAIGSYYYNIATRTQLGLNYYTTQTVLTTSETGFYLWIYGSKNLVLFFTKISSTYYRILFGHMNKTLNPLLTTLTSSITTGSNVTLTVSGTAGFDLLATYQIMGAYGEGRDPVTISSIISPTQMIATSIARNYAADALIGISPSLFGQHNSGTTGWTLNSPLYTVGTGNCTNYSSGTISAPKTITGVDPDIRTGKYLLQPLLVDFSWEGTASYASIGFGYNDEFLLQAPTVGLTLEDTFAYGKLDSGTSTGTNTSGTLNDTSKTWTVNAYANKTIITTFGTAPGQIKKIASNTATTITLDVNYSFNPSIDNTTQYVICEEGYRYLYNGQSPAFACREGYYWLINL